MNMLPDPDGDADDSDAVDGDDDGVNTFLIPEPCTNNPPGRAGREPYQLVLSSASTSALSLGVLVVCLLLLSFLNH
ncbi:hypothetical protein ACOMHN_049736 [Nucella lapillus]